MALLCVTFQGLAWRRNLRRIGTAGMEVAGVGRDSLPARQRYGQVYMTANRSAEVVDDHVLLEVMGRPLIRRDRLTIFA